MTNSEPEATEGNDRLVITRDMLMNDRRCQLRLTVTDDFVDLAFDATDRDQVVVGSVAGTIVRDDLVSVAKAFNMTLASAATALGLTTLSRSVDLDELRKRHPRAYEPWSADEDERLIQRYRDGVPLSELCQEFGRTVGGITSRLKMHSLIPSTRPAHYPDADPNADYADLSDPESDQEDWT